MATAIMKQKEVPEMDDVEEIISKISEDSPYKRRPTQKRTWMTVPEMGKLLGLKKTDRYWLVHKNVFESKEIAGKIRINIASFEKWYANQIKYHKVTGEEPGKELKSWSYSVKEVADLLGVDEYLVYDLLKKNQMEAVIVDYWKRIPKESFQNWYKSQSRYRTKEDRKKDALLEDATITMPEMAQLLGTTRSAVYTILDNPKYSHFFEFIVIAEKKRITKESFQKFLEGQDRYMLDPSNDYEELAQEQNIALANFRRKKLSQTGIRGSNGNIKYLTFDEASYLAKVSRSMINKWADKGKFTVIKVGSRVRIRRDEFEDWMEQRDVFLGIAGDDDDLLCVASVFSQEELSEFDSDAYDSICELINVINGAYATKLSYEDIEVALHPPVFYKDTQIKADNGMYVVTFSMKGHRFNLIMVADDKIKLEV